MELSKEIIDLFKLFADAGELLYLVGGAVRDNYLNREVGDLDFATTATPSKLESILKNKKVDKYPLKYGAIKVFLDDGVVEITTLRKEEGVVNGRYPSDIHFVKEVEVDAVRRDFTINSLYYNPKIGLIDPMNGLDDLNKHLIRFNKDVETSLKEDPIRALRALRFQELLGFEIVDEEKVLNCSSLLKEIKTKRYQELLALFKINAHPKVLFKNLDFFKESFPEFDFDKFMDSDDYYEVYMGLIKDEYKQDILSVLTLPKEIRKKYK